MNLYKIIRCAIDQKINLFSVIGDVIKGYYRVVKCPICGKYMLDSYDICRTCGWEYDGIPDNQEISTANGLSIEDYKKWYNGDKTIEKRSPSFPKSWFPTDIEYEKAANILAKICILDDIEFFTDSNGLIHKYRYSTHEFVVYRKLKDDELIYTFFPMTDNQWILDKELYDPYWVVDLED